jgi:hypothetical protein
MPRAGRCFSNAVAHGSVIPWQHINLLGEYDFSDERLRDSGNNAGFNHGVRGKTFRTWCRAENRQSEAAG